MIAAVLNGAVAMACGAIGVFFVRFWRESRDRLFLCLTLGFWMLGVNYGVLGALPATDEHRAYALLLRLIGFIAILAGVWLRDRELIDHLQLTDEEDSNAF